MIGEHIYFEILSKQFNDDAPCPLVYIAMSMDHRNGTIIGSITGPALITFATSAINLLRYQRWHGLMQRIVTASEFWALLLSNRLAGEPYSRKSFSLTPI